MKKEILYSFGSLLVGIGLVVAGQSLKAEGLQGITFPITELGGCTDMVTCRQYCANPEHYSACHVFAAQHHLEKRPEVANTDLATRKAELLARAKSILGCDTVEVCRALCEQPQNHERCAALLREIKPQFQNGPLASIEPSFCDDPAHVQQCLEMAKKYIIAMKNGGLGCGPGVSGQVPPRPLPFSSVKPERPLGIPYTSLTP